MRLLGSAAILVFVLATESVSSQTSEQLAALASASVSACGQGYLFDPMSGRCASTLDRRSEVASPSATAEASRLPGLSQLRVGLQRRAGAEGGPPVPGGIGAGTTYRTGRLKIDREAALYTHMIVYVGGAGTMPDWLFTTATNRTDKTIEVVGIYNPSTPRQGDLGVFDWSCSPDYPCPNGSTGASWQWTRPFTDFSCDITVSNDDGGHAHSTLYYVNRALQADSEVVPLWSNEVWLWNYCGNNWDLVYSHTFRVQQRDCSFDGQCGWWGPIIETFATDPQPEVPELGFTESLLLHDGVWSWLRGDETQWSAPVTPWAQFHLDPNRGWGVGSWIDQSVYSLTVSKSGTGDGTVTSLVSLTVLYTGQSSPGWCRHPWSR